MLFSFAHYFVFCRVADTNLGKAWGQYSKSFEGGESRKQNGTIFQIFWRRLRIQKTLLSRPANAWALIKLAVEVPRKAKGQTSFGQRGQRKVRQALPFHFSDAAPSFCSLCLHNVHLQENMSPQVLVIAHCQVKKILLELLEPMSAACRGAEMFSDTLACIPLFRTMRSVVPCILKHWHIGSRLYQGTGTMQLLHRFTQWQNAESCSVV